MTDYDRIIEIKNEHPELTFDNKGYQYLSFRIKDYHKKQIEELHNILRRHLEGFVEFNNFKPRKDNTFDIRVQYYWNERFTGVGYFNIEQFK